MCFLLTRLLPFLGGNIRLLKYTGEKWKTDITTVRIGYRQCEIITPHKAMFSSRLWPAETQRTQPSNEFTMRNRPELRHTYSANAGSERL